MKRSSALRSYRVSGKRFFFRYRAPADKTRAAREGAWNEKDLPVGSRGAGEFRFASICRGGIARGKPFVRFDAAFFGAELSLGTESQLFERIQPPLFVASSFLDAKLPQLLTDPFAVHADDDRSESDLHFKCAAVEWRPHYCLQFAQLHPLEYAVHAA